MPLRVSLLVISLLWAAIYLPALGSIEIKGEEGRRILPAVEMIERGDWLVPHFHGRPYLRKPPLVNWLIGASMEVCGARNEWTARLPSALAVLALAVTLATAARRWLGTESALLAAIFALTNIGMIEKGRLAELEAVYIALYGIAITLWLSWRAGGRSPWLVWLVPSVALGLGLLAKAPLHLLYFYAIAVPVILAGARVNADPAGSPQRRAGWRELLHPAHFVALAVMLAIFAAWALPYFRATAHLGAAGIWGEQMRERVGGGSFNLAAWLVNLPRGLSNYLPWLLLLPLLWSRRLVDGLAPPDAAIVRATRWPLVICFFGLLLIPGMLPRYTMPMLVPASLLLALVCARSRPELPGPALRTWRYGNLALAGVVALGSLATLVAGPGRAVALLVLAGGAGILWLLFFQRRNYAHRPLWLACATAALIALAISLYAIAAVPRMNARADTRQFADRVNAVVPAGATLHVFDPGLLPAMFYIRARPVYTVSYRELPDRAEYVLTRADAAEKMRKRWEEVRVLAEAGGEGKKRFLVLQLAGKRER